MLAAVSSTLFALGGSAKPECAAAAKVEPHAAEPSNQGFTLVERRKRALWLRGGFGSELPRCRHAPV